MLIVHNDFTHTPESTYVSGWYNEKLFEFVHFYENHVFEFGATPLINGRHESCKPLSESEQEAVKDSWLTGNYKDG
jgi:hypothetical protein